MRSLVVSRAKARESDRHDGLVAPEGSTASSNPEPGTRYASADSDAEPPERPLPSTPSDSVADIRLDDGVVQLGDRKLQQVGLGVQFRPVLGIAAHLRGRR